MPDLEGAQRIQGLHPQRGQRQAAALLRGVGQLHAVLVLGADIGPDVAGCSAAAQPLQPHGVARTPRGVVQVDFDRGALASKHRRSGVQAQLQPGQVAVPHPDPSRRTAGEHESEQVA